jgi:hypothetical protein
VASAIKTVCRVKMFAVTSPSSGSGATVAVLFFTLTGAVAAVAGAVAGFVASVVAPTPAAFDDAGTSEILVLVSVGAGVVAATTGASGAAETLLVPGGATGVAPLGEDGCAGAGSCGSGNGTAAVGGTWEGCAVTVVAAEVPLSLEAVTVAGGAPADAFALSGGFTVAVEAGTGEGTATAGGFAGVGACARCLDGGMTDLMIACGSGGGA